MIDKSGDISKMIGVNAKSVTILVVQVKQVRVFPGFCFGVGNQFTYVLADKGSLRNRCQRPHAPAHAKGPKDLETYGNSVLDDPIVTAGHIAATKVVAFEDHGRFPEIEAFFQAALKVVPRFDAEVGTVAGFFSGTVIRTFAML